MRRLPSALAVSALGSRVSAALGAVALVVVGGLGCATAEPKPEPAPTAEPAKPPPPKEDPEPKGQLPDTIVPSRYALDLVIDPRQETFSGTVTIDVTLAEPRQVLWMHAADMAEMSAVLTIGETAIEGTLVEHNDTGLAKLTLASVAPAGTGTLVVTYVSPFDQELKGIYHAAEAGEHYAFTQFEATSFRYAVPSFDEPRFKTPFQATVTTSGGDVAISNTRETTVEDLGDGKQKWVFAETRPLPTYLVAFAVGPLDVVEADPIPTSEARPEPLAFRGVTVKGKGDQLAYALAETPKILAFQEAYFGQPYPFSKLDIIAVNDFASGAMENVGAVTFREWLLLVDPETAPARQKWAFAGVMAHELAHMWFGNKVTMPWWDDIWLNEAFATWFAARTTAAVYPSYGADVRLVDEGIWAMGVDSLAAARQIRQPIDTDHDIRNAFDGITYDKGGHVLSMFEAWLGEEIFRKGLAAYMEKHAYGSATYEDLLASLDEASGKDVTTPFKTFLFQPGVPVVDVELECGEGKNVLRMEQQRYLPAGSSGEPDQTWQVPVCMALGFAKGEPTTTCTLLEDRTGKIELDACPTSVHPNPEGAGYYRFGLPRELLDAVDVAKLSPRSQLIFADALAAAVARGTLPIDVALERMEPLLRSDEARVVELGLDMLRFTIDHLVDDDTERASARKRAARLLRKPMLKVGLSPKAGESRQQAELRAALVRFFVLDLRDPKVTEALAESGRRYFGRSAAKGFDDGALHKDAVAPDLAETAVIAAVMTGDVALFDALLERLATEGDNLVRSHIVKALPHALDEALAERRVALPLHEALRTNEIRTALFYSYALPEHAAASWAWFVDNGEAVIAKLPTTRKGYAPFLARDFCSEEEKTQLSSWFSSRIEAMPGGPRNLAQVEEAISLCAAKRQAQRAAAAAWLTRKR